LSGELSPVYGSAEEMIADPESETSGTAGDERADDAGRTPSVRCRTRRPGQTVGAPRCPCWRCCLVGAVYQSGSDPKHSNHSAHGGDIVAGMELRARRTGMTVGDYRVSFGDRPLERGSSSVPRDPVNRLGKGVPIRLTIPGLPFGARHYAILPDDDQAPVVIYRNMTALKLGSWRVTAS